MTVVTVDFGKDARESARQFARLLSLADEMDADILANPSKYLDMASARLAEAERFKYDLYNAIHTPWMAKSFSEPAPTKLPDIIQIDRRDYEALQSVKALIKL